MAQTNAAGTISNWPDESRQAAQLVIDEHGEPDEATDTQRSRSAGRRRRSSESQWLPVHPAV
jgi:hypothetical protein